MRKNSTGILTLLGIGAYYLYKNRFEVQRFLQSYGISIPSSLMGNRLTDTVRSGVAQATGAVEYAGRKIDSTVRRVS